MDFSSMSCSDFVNVLASSEPVPGGGGASALVGAVGAALGSMVANLTIGKKKYADVEENMRECLQKAEDLQSRLLDLIRQDAEAFAPLAAAYGMPKTTVEEMMAREAVMEPALREAAAVPLAIMETCCEALDVMHELALKGSRLVISDAGVGAACCRAALQGASLNVFINTRSMSDRDAATQINRRAKIMLDDYIPLADRIFTNVQSKLFEKN